MTALTAGQRIYDATLKLHGTVTITPTAKGATRVRVDYVNGAWAVLRLDDAAARLSTPRDGGEPGGPR